MNLGGLKLQVNSQLQLNNDWFVSKSENQTKTFDNILKNTSFERSEVERGPSQKIDNSTMNNSAASINQERSDFNEEIKTLKEAIKNEIAKKKFQKENDLSDDPIKSFDEAKKQLEAIDLVIKKELGLDDEENLEVLAEMLGIDLEVIVELFSDVELPVEAEEIVFELVDQISSQEIELEALVEEIVKTMEQVATEEVKAVENLVEQIIEAMPEGELKENLIMQLEEKLPEVQVEAKVLPEEEVKTEVKEEVKSEIVKVVEKTENKEVKVQEVKVDVKTETETDTEDKKPEFRGQKVTLVKEQTSIEDQVAMMKSQSAIVSDVKEMPKNALVRNVMNQVVQGVKMSVNMSDQGSEILIKLNPKQLGNVELKMAFEGEKLVAQIQVENQTVKSILESNLEDLRNALKDSGYSVEGLEVSVNQDDTEQREQAFANLFKGKRRQFIDDEEIVFEERNFVSDKEVDYLA